MYQICGCSLSVALKNFCPKDIDGEVAKKLEFKDEIMFIYNNYASNPEILKPGVVSQLTKKIYDKDQVTYKHLNKSVCLHDEVIHYADNDTNVLPILYRAMDNLSKDILGANVMSFLTAGSMSWYGFICNLSNDAMILSKTD